MSLFNRNAVITGLLDSFCLPCEIRLGTENDIKDHIASLRHQENLESTSYLNKDDGIRKVPKGYYCEYCNKLYFTKISVRLHVAEGEHRRSKDSQWLREQSNVVTVLNQLAIDGDSWHGLVEGTCALCNSEYLDKDAHKTVSSHILKLIQNPVHLHTSGAIYRKGDDFFHCLVCNAIFSLTTFATHFDQPSHVKFYNKCCESFKNLMTPLNINGTTALTVESGCNYENITDSKPIKKKPAFEIETNIESQEDNLEIQSTIDNKSLRTDDKVESPPKKDCRNITVQGNELLIYQPWYEEVSELEINDNYLEFIAPESFETKHFTAQDYKNNVHVNLAEPDLNRVKTVADESFQTQQISATLEEVNKETHSRNVSNSDEGITAQEHIYKAQPLEVRETNDTEVTFPESLQTQQTIEIVQQNNRESLPEYGQKIPAQQDIGNIQLCEVGQDDNHVLDETPIKVNEISQVEIDPLSNHEGEKDQNISVEQPVENEQLSEIESNGIHSEILPPECCQTHQTIEKLQEDKENSQLNQESQSITTVAYLEKNICTKQQPNKHNENNSDDTKEYLRTEQKTSNRTTQEFDYLEGKSLSKKEKAQMIAKANKIRYKEGYTIAFCSICVTDIPSSLKNIKRHVINSTHRHKAKQVFNYVSDVMPMEKFIEQITFIELTPQAMFVVLNNSYCVEFWSYLLMSRCHSYIRCHVCELNINVNLFEDHRSSQTHIGALGKIPVLCSLPKEFVREVQPGFYQCGFCNVFEGSWRDLRVHLRHQSHLDRKSKANKTLLSILSNKT